MANFGESEPQTVVSTPWRRVRPTWRTVALVMATFNLYWFYWFWATWRDLKQETKDKRMRPFGHLFSLFVPVYQLFQIYAHFRVIKDVIAQRSGPKATAPPLLSPGVALILFLLGGFLIRLSAFLSAGPTYAHFLSWYGTGLIVLGTLLGCHLFPDSPPQGTFYYGGFFHMSAKGFYVEFPFYFSIGPGLSLVVFLASMGVFVSLIAGAQQGLNLLWQSVPETVLSDTRRYHRLVLALGAVAWSFLLWTILG